MSPAASLEDHLTNLGGNAETPAPYPDLRRILRDRQTARTRNSCLPCRERKVRCNRGHPCLTCIKRDHPDLCIYTGGAASPAHQGGARRAALHAQGEGRGEREPLSLRSPAADIRPTPRADDLAQSTVASPSTDASSSTHTSPPGISLIGGSSLVAIAREHSPQPYDNDASRRDVLENAVIPLLGMAGVDEAGMEHRDHKASHNDDPYANLPGDQELLNLFSVYRLRVHPFQLIIDDLDAVESELCEIINQRAESSLGQKSQRHEQVSADRSRFLCLLHAILATGAHFSDLPVGDRSAISQRHVRCAFHMLRVCNSLLLPFGEGLRALIILGHVLQNDGNPQAAWILGGSTIRMAVTLGVHATSSTTRFGPSPIPAESARHLRLSIVWQDALLSLAFNRQPAAHEMDSVDDLPALSRPSPNSNAGLGYGQAMNWLCHLTLRHWSCLSFRPGNLTIERFTSFFSDMDTLERALQDHLRSREACHSIHAIQEFYSLELHRNFTISTFCRPILSKNRHQSLDSSQADMILDRLQRALKRSVKAFIRLRSVTSHATRSWAFIHNGLTSALLLSFMKETRNEDESRQIQDELIKCLTEGDDILASKSASGGIFEKSLKALKLLRKITEEERLRKNESDTIDRDTMAFSNPPFPDDAMNAVQDPGSAEFDELLRSFDFSSALPMEAFDYYTSDLTAPGANFEAFNPI